MDDFDTLNGEAERLRIDLLESELESTRTLIELTDMELQQGNSADTAQGLIHVHQGIETIREFIGRISSRQNQARLTEKLAQLEAAAAQLGRDSQKKQNR